MQFALLYAAETYDTRTKLMGRQTAGEGFLRAALMARPERVWCLAGSRQQAQDFEAQVALLSSEPPDIRVISHLELHKLGQAGTLYRPDPGIGEHAWHRQYHRGARGYSLCGVTHTLSSFGALDLVADLVAAPVYPWDALICTSRVVRDIVERVLQQELDHLRRRMQITPPPLPHFPIIPLGVHCEDFAFSANVREESRSRLGLDENEVAVLFVGRLVFHSKAHPLPMFLGLEGAAKRTKRRIRLILCGEFPNKSIQDAFMAEAATFAPSIELTLLDGTKKIDRDAAWSSADIFTSFSDNIQETFGLTPIEAMAAGLPVVVSDWNGYKDTVRDGVDGFRIPAWAPPPTFGEDLVDRYDRRIDHYDKYIGGASQFVAVDIDAAIEAFSKLAESESLRRQMGEAGRSRAREVFDWPIVFGRYTQLWERLAELRRTTPPIPAEDSNARKSSRQEPFTLFRSFPTDVPGKRTQVRLRRAVASDEVAAQRRLASVGYAAAVHPPEVVVSRILAGLSESDWTTFGVLLERNPDLPPKDVVRALLWLAKMGFATLRQP